MPACTCPIVSHAAAMLSFCCLVVTALQVALDQMLYRTLSRHPLTIAPAFHCRYVTSLVDQAVVVPYVVPADTYTIDFNVRTAADLLYGVQFDDLKVTSFTAPMSDMTGSTPPMDMAMMEGTIVSSCSSKYL